VIDVQEGLFTGASYYGNEVWTNNKADLNVASGAIFDGVEATTTANGGIFVDALTGAGTIKVGYSGYASKITFGVDNGSGTFDGVLANSVHTGSYVKTGTGTQILTNTSTYTGTTTVSNGTLKVSGSIASSDVTVNGGILASGSTGTVGKSVTVNSGATLAAGGVGAVGAASVASNLKFSSGSIFEWDLAMSKDANGAGGNDGVAGTDFDSVSVAGTLNADTTGAIFKVVFGASALADITNAGNAFWNTPYGTQTWNMSAIFGKTFDTNAFTIVQTSNDVSSYGSFTISGSSLTWTAVPEPTSALAGLLLTAGLLRRRRA
jgi:autotransporter-associated beta strand protein